MIRSTLAFPGVAVRHRDLLRSFVWRDLAARYEGTLLGRLLPAVYPLLLLAVYHLVFAWILEMRWGENQLPGGWSTTFYLLSGILPWLCFADTLARSTTVVVENANLIKRIAFPSELLPTFVALAQLVHFAISLGLFVVLYGVVVFAVLPGATAFAAVSHLLYLPIPLVLQLVFSIGVAMILSTAAVFVRDLSQVVGVILLLWMLVSPIFYPIELVAAKAAEHGREWMLDVIRLNPVYHLLAMYRACFPEKVLASGELAAFPWGSCLVFAALALGAFAVGHRFFLACKGLFPDEV